MPVAAFSPYDGNMWTPIVCIMTSLMLVLLAIAVSKHRERGPIRLALKLTAVMTAVTKVVATAAVATARCCVSDVRALYRMFAGGSEEPAIPVEQAPGTDVLNQGSIIAALRSQLSDAQAEAAASRADSFAKLEQIRVHAQACADAQAETVALHDHYEIQNAAIRADADATIAASNQMMENVMRAAGTRQHAETARSSAQGANMQINGIYQGCQFYYSSGTTNGAKVIHSTDNCNDCRNVKPGNRCEARPCKHCFEPALPKASPPRRNPVP